MRIGLFGGSFNPPHVCHVMATVWALETRALDEVWWVPAEEHAFSKELVSYEMRREMCQRAVEPLGDVRISDVEHELGGESRTIDTVRELRERRPGDSFALLVGADILEETDDWKEWETLVDLVDLIVVGRSDYERREPVADFELPNVSSTEIRQALRERRDRAWLEDWVPTEVLDFVDEHGLYRDETDG